MTDPTTTQKIRIDLQDQIKQAEQKHPSIENSRLVQWLKSKLSFYEDGWHRVYDQQNGT